MIQCRFCTESFKTAYGALVHSKKQHVYETREWLTEGLRSLPNIEEMPFTKTNEVKCVRCDSYSAFLYTSPNEYFIDCADCGFQHGGERKVKQQRADINKFIREAKTKPCTDCKGVFPPICMDFDHLPEHDKKFNISQSNSYDEADIRSEIEKCEVVCSNCHRIRTADRHLLKSDKDQERLALLQTELSDAGPSIIAGFVSEDLSEDEEEFDPGVQELPF